MLFQELHAHYDALERLIYCVGIGMCALGFLVYKTACLVNELRNLAAMQREQKQMYLVQEKQEMSKEIQ